MHPWASQRCIVDSTYVNDQKVHEVIYLTEAIFVEIFTRLYNQALYNQAGATVNPTSRGVRGGWCRSLTHYQP